MSDNECTLGSADSRALTQIREMLEAFIADRDRSLALAGTLEVALDRAFPQDERFEDLVLALASYRPGGGDLLYSEETIQPLCQTALAEILAAGRAPTR